MAVNYADFRDIAIENYDAVVVGSGFAGAVSARQLAEEGGLRVLVIEKRAHIAGNIYDEYDEAGVLVHRYGPHIFHTNDQRAYDYLARFTEWSSYQHRVLADWFGTYMPVPFNKNSMEIAFGDEKAARLIEKLVDTFGDERKVTINELRAQEDPELQEVADFVYQNVFLYYTQKQWGLTPEEVDPSVTARVPVFISRDNRYFQDAFQGMPVDGYTRLFENLLGHEKITVCLSTEAESVFDLVFAGREEDAGARANGVRIAPLVGHGGRERAGHAALRGHGFGGGIVVGRICRRGPGLDGLLHRAAGQRQRRRRRPSHKGPPREGEVQHRKGSFFVFRSLLYRKLEQLEESP